MCNSDEPKEQKSKDHGVTIEPQSHEMVNKDLNLAARRRQFMPQQSSVATRRLHAICVRRAHKSYGPKNNKNVVLDGLNMTVPKGVM